jgi:hypothetical protein
MNEHAIIRHSNKLNTHAYKQHKQTNKNIIKKKMTAYQKKKLEIEGRQCYEYLDLHKRESQQYQTSNKFKISHKQQRSRSKP